MHGRPRACAQDHDRPSLRVVVFDFARRSGCNILSPFIAFDFAVIRTAGDMRIGHQFAEAVGVAKGGAPQIPSNATGRGSSSGASFLSASKGLVPK